MPRQLGVEWFEVSEKVLDRRLQERESRALKIWWESVKDLPAPQFTNLLAFEPLDFRKMIPRRTR